MLPDDEDTLETPPSLAVLDFWQAEAGHGGCDGYAYATGDDHLTCFCGARIPAAKAAA